MSQIAATKKSDLITLPRSTSGLVQQINTVPTVINLRAIGDQAFNAASASGEAPGLQDTYCSIFADAGADFVLYGHTHAHVVRRIGNTTIVNPGSAGDGRDIAATGGVYTSVIFAGAGE